MSRALDPWQGATLALLAGVLMHWVTSPWGAEARGLQLRPGVELTQAPVTVREIQSGGPDEGLALRPSRELAGSAPAAQPDTQFEILTAFALFLFATIVALLAASLLVRWSRETREGRDGRFRELWEPVLYGRMAGDAVPLPPLAADDRILLLKLWLHVLGYVRDEAIDGLLEVANQLEFPRLALHLLESRAAQERLIAIQVVAALRLKEAIAPLQDKVEQARPHSSLEAASALLQISPEHGFAALRNLLGRVDWAPGALIGMLKTGGEGAAGMLVDLLRTMPPGAGTPVLRLIGLLDDYTALPALRERLQGNSDVQEISVILHAFGKLGGAGERAAAIDYLGHPGWLARMQAAAALGELGLSGDWERLLPLLRDPEWWVRYRAAQSLLRLGGATAVLRAREAGSDRYANDILDRVEAES